METATFLKQLLPLIFCIIHVEPTFADTEMAVKIGSLPYNLCPTLKCGSSYISLTFLKDELTINKLDLTDIHFINSSCKSVVESEKISIQSPTKVGHCGTYAIVNGTHAIYKNIVYLHPNPSSVVYREDVVIDISCIYPLNMDVSLGTVLSPLLSTINFNITGEGSFEVKMALYKDPAYTFPRENTDTLTTKDTLYIGVILTEGDKSHFNLEMKNCFATPTQDINSSLKYYIIQNSCKNENDNTIQIAANGVTYYGQFSVQAFRFIGYSNVFLHCQVHLCDKSKYSCVPTCNRGRAASGSPEEQVAQYVTIGALSFKDPENLCPASCSYLQCDASHMNVTLQKKDLMNANVDIANLHLNYPNCRDIHEDGKSVSIGWPLGGGICGTTLTTNITHASYENSIYLAPNPSQIIYRQEYYVSVTCVYPLDMKVSLKNALNPIISNITIPSIGIGSFQIVMAAFKDQAYQQPYQEGELTLSTKNRLFVGVAISEGDTDQFNLVMQHCYATPTQNPADATNYGLIVNSCPNKEDGTVEVYANGILSYGQFSFQMFKFIKYDYVFLHCKVHLCSKSSTCAPVCSGGKSRSAAPETHTVTFGPISITDPEKLCPDLQCGASYINVTFQKNDIINVDIPNLHLNDPNCGNIYEDGKSLSIGWPLGVRICGTTLTTNETHATYENSIYLAPNPSQIIYRYEYYVNVFCIYPLDMSVSLQKVLNPLIKNITIPVVGSGNFKIVMAAFKDQAYQEPYQQGEIYISTKSRLFVGIFISEGDTDNFLLVMQYCYATPTQNPEDTTNYELIMNSCPNEADGTVEVHGNGVTSYGQFSFQMFKFIKYSSVFLHCKVHLCRKSSSCAPSCSRAKFRSAAEQTDTDTLTLGPFYKDSTGDTTESAAATTATTILKTTSNAGKSFLDLLTFIVVLLITVLL